MMSDQQRPSLSSSDLDVLLETDMNVPLDPSVVQTILSHPPFITLPGALNIRDLGLLPNSPIAPGLIYRSGAIHAVSPTALSNLGIKMILDLRSEREVKAHPDPVVDGVQNVWMPGRKAPRAIDLGRFVEERGVRAYTEMYLEILEIYAPSVLAAMEGIREGKGPVLFHCTGMSFAVLLGWDAFS